MSIYTGEDAIPSWIQSREQYAQYLGLPAGTNMGAYDPIWTQLPSTPGSQTPWQAAPSYTSFTGQMANGGWGTAGDPWNQNYDEGDGGPGRALRPAIGSLSGVMRVNDPAPYVAKGLKVSYDPTYGYLINEQEYNSLPEVQQAANSGFWNKFSNALRYVPLALGGVVGAAGLGVGPLAGGSLLGSAAAPAAAGATAGAGTGLLSAADTALLDTAGMGAGGNLGGAALGGAAAPTAAAGAGTGSLYSLGSETAANTLSGGYSSLAGNAANYAPLAEGAGVGGTSALTNPYSLASGLGGAGVGGAGAGFGGATVGGATTAAAMGGAAAAAGGTGGFWQSVFQPLASTATSAATGAPGGSVAGSVLGGVLEAVGQNQYANDVASNTAQAAAMANPVSQAERERNQGLIQNLWGPNGAQYMAQDSGFQAGNNLIAARNNKLGQAFSGANATDLVNYAMSKRNEITNTLSPLAGYQFGPGQAAQIQATGGNEAAKAQQNVMAGIGYAARPIVNRASDYLSSQFFV